MTERTRDTFIVQALPDCDPIIGTALWGLQESRRRTRETLKNLKPQSLDWQPVSGGHTIGTLMYHVAMIELDWFIVEAMDNKYPQKVDELVPYPVRDEAGNLTIVKGEALEAQWARLDKVRALLLDGYKNMMLAEFRRPRSFEHYDVTPEWVLYHLMLHESEHRDEIRRLCQQAEKALNDAN